MKAWIAETDGGPEMLKMLRIVDNKTEENMENEMGAVFISVFRGIWNVGTEIDRVGTWRALYADDVRIGREQLRTPIQARCSKGVSSRRTLNPQPALKPNAKPSTLNSKS